MNIYLKKDCTPTTEKQIGGFLHFFRTGIGETAADFSPSCLCTAEPDLKYVIMLFVWWVLSQFFYRGFWSWKQLPLPPFLQQRLATASLSSLVLQQAGSITGSLGWGAFIYLWEQPPFFTLKKQLLERLSPYWSVTDELPSSWPSQHRSSSSFSKI